MKILNWIRLECWLRQKKTSVQWPSITLETPDFQIIQQAFHCESAKIMSSRQFIPFILMNWPWCSPKVIIIYQNKMLLFVLLLNSIHQCQIMSHRSRWVDAGNIATEISSPRPCLSLVCPPQTVSDSGSSRTHLVSGSDHLSQHYPLETFIVEFTLKTSENLQHWEH